MGVRETTPCVGLDLTLLDGGDGLASLYVCWCKLETCTERQRHEENNEQRYTKTNEHIYTSSGPPICSGMGNTS